MFIGLFGRVVPEQKYRLVKTLQDRGHVVGMCGDGANDGPALRQAQIGIAVSSATDVAKAAAAVVLTEPGLAGAVLAVREGRIAFQRMLTYTLNMLVKKIEIVLFLALGLILTGHPVMTPVLMVLLLVTNDFLSMSLTTDRASPASSPSVWRMRRITAAGAVLGGLQIGLLHRHAHGREDEARARDGRITDAGIRNADFRKSGRTVCAAGASLHLWSSMPSRWVLASSAVDISFVATLALSGVLMEPLPARLVMVVFAAAIGFALLLDQIKSPILAFFKVVGERQDNGRLTSA